MRWRRREIVWARATNPKKWWPGLVLRNDALGVFVSFFNMKKPRYFLESEVCSFEENFDSLVKTLNGTCSEEEALLDSALKFLGRRVFSSLRCPCQFTSAKKRTHVGGDSFDANGILGFVLDLAVSPLIEDSGLVYGVTVAARLMVFRRYVVSKQKKLLLLEEEALERQRHERNCESVSPIDTLSKSHSPFCQTVHLVAKKSDLSDRSHTQNEQMNLQFLHQMLECSHRSSGVQLSYTHCIDGEPSFKVDGKDSSEFFGSNIPFMGRSINFVGLKRLHDQPADSGFCFKLCKTTPLLSINRVDNLQETNTNPLSICRVDTHAQKNKIICEGNPSDAYYSGSQLEVETQALYSHRVQRLTFSCNSDLLHLVQNMFNTYHIKDMPHGKNSSEFSLLPEEKNVDSLYEKRACLSLVQLKESESSACILDDDGTFLSANCNCIENENITNGIQTEDVRENCNLSFLQSSFSESVPTCAILTHLDTGNIGEACAVTSNCMLSHSTTDQSLMEPSNGDNATSVETNEAVCINVTFKDSTADNKDLHQHISSDLPFKSLVAQQSAVSTYSSKSLHMKFPKDFKLPSKSDLIKKLSRFGRIDLPRTRIFNYLGSAQVVFLNELDAVTAYQFMKRKKNLFHEARILFWLDPYEHKRKPKLSPYLSLPQKELNLKSCIKVSSQSEKDDRKCSRKVRFLIET